MSYDPRFLVGWLAILGAGGVWELIALRRRGAPDTLSELVWAVLRSHRGVYAAFCLFWGWLTLHLLTGGRFPPPPWGVGQT